MNTRRKCIALSTTAASSVGVTSCAMQPRTAAVSDTPPEVLVDNARVPTTTELYGQRYRTGVTQVRDGNRIRFVECPSCAGATPKTSVVNIQQATRRRAREALLAREFAETQPQLLNEKAAPNGAAAQRVLPDPADAAPTSDLRVRPAVLTVKTPPEATKDSLEGSPIGMGDEALIDQSKPVSFEKANPSQNSGQAPGASPSLTLEFAEPAVSARMADLGEPLDVVIFRGGSAWLDSKSEDQLKQLADAWVAASGVEGIEGRPLLIAGFTDSWPTKTPSFNEYLARRRAEVVREVLLRHGVPDTAMKVVHHVQCCYVADNQTAAGRAKNRRTEIHVL